MVDNFLAQNNGIYESGIHSLEFEKRVWKTIKLVGTANLLSFPPRPRLVKQVRPTLT